MDLIAAFKKWKHDIERKELTSYTLRHGARKTSTGLKFFYVCHRSGKYASRVTGPRQRMLKTPGTCKLGIVCTAAIYCEECPDSVIVRYCPHHYGHGKETSFVQLSVEEQAAIQDNISKGIPFESLLDDIRDSQSSTDHFQLYLLKKRDVRFINNAYATDEYNPGLSDAESVDQWVRLCCQMEDSPILFYRQEDIGSTEEDFLLIIMTEFQKQILMSSAKQVVCVDSLYRRKGGRFYLTVLFIMDEYEIAFPVAFCISNKVDKPVIWQFLTSIKESTGPLSCTYFMSDSESFYFEAWKEVMEDESKWLWSMWYVDNRIRVQLRVFRGNIVKRAEAYKTMRTLLECQNKNVFDSMFKNYIETLQSDPQSRNLGNFIMQKYGSNAEMWAYCYRKDIPLSTNIHLEVMHRTFRYCCREGRKKRLDKFIFVIMKLVRYKMLDRLSNMLDDEKIELAIEAINMCHHVGLEIPSEHISSLSDKIWLIRSEEEEQSIYVMREFETCPEHCNLRCSECDICVHMYTCSCIHSMINANLCQHIHAVVWKFLTPHFSPPASPIQEDIKEQENIDVSDIPDKCPELFDKVLKQTHDVYKKVRANKCNLPKDSLTAVMKRLNECIDICNGKKVTEPVVNNSPQKDNPVYVINPYTKKENSQSVLYPKFSRNNSVKSSCGDNPAVEPNGDSVLKNASSDSSSPCTVKKDDQNFSALRNDDNSNCAFSDSTGVEIDKQKSSVSQQGDKDQVQEMDDEKKKIQKETYGTYIKCIECNTNYKNVQSLRDHLSSEHNLNMDKQELHFPNMAAFKKWKHEIERQELTSYTLRHGFKKTKKGIRKNDYCCHRSGKNSSKIDGERKRMLKTTGTVKLGIICTSVMVCEERPDGVKVQYYPHHYGHGKDLSIVHLSPEEQDAIEENVAKGIPFENLLDDIKDNHSSADHFQLYLKKKKEARFISNAYAADEYNPGVAELESVDQWVRQCCKMENSPILFYISDDSTENKNFLLIIMTEFQKQILLSAAKQVVCVDTLYRKSGGFYLNVLIVMDDSDNAFPVAFCLSNKVDRGVMLQFFMSIKESTGALSFEYFMSDSDVFMFESWKDIMDDDSKWLWCMWYVDNRIRIQLKVFRGNVIKKAEAYKTVRSLLECQNVNVFESMFRNFVETLKADPNSRNLGISISQRYGKNVHLWAYCYRKDIPLSTNIQLEVLHRTFQFCCREGRKKRLDKFLFVVMKLVKYKVLDRLCNILDDEKTELAIEAINMCHNEGLEIASERITSLSDKIWLIEGEEEEQNIYVMREFESCPEHCSLRCNECDICVHMYTCSCIHSVINANMCPHIHAVVWKFLTPHFSPPPSPMADDFEEQENRDVSVIPDKVSDLLEEILNKSHDVYKIIRENKCNLPKESLTAVLKRLNECIDIGRGKDVSEFAISNSQNVLSVVLPNNCQDISQFVFVLPGNEANTIVPNNDA
ncbi:hypothetical protein HNY73_017849 [Argiope bruennichi]|uniref:C2H2-type domain-containing protein n=1 Tax=Argiope bruennichi TaxID=94029 RepID=A0A8T0EB32_ARGBR|nr:hypothetical protein HNY73_017849 [Argiope bruennichi]